MVNKVDANQLNQNLILDQTAEIFAKPQLEIQSSDIKCSHGSSTGQLNKGEIFYLQSRGLSYEVAIKMLCTAFGMEILRHLHSEELTKTTLQKLEAMLSSLNIQNKVQ